MRTLTKITLYAYLLFGIFFIEETIRTWGEDKSRTVLYIALSIMAIFMFIFRFRFQKKIDQREKHNR